MPVVQLVRSLVSRVNHLVSCVPEAAVLLVVRLALVWPFWNSGSQKWVYFPIEVTDTEKFLFAEEFKLHLGFATVPFPFPEQMAFMAALAEVVLSLLLVFGLFSRLAALGLVGMLVVIQLTQPGGWAIHLTWLAMMLTVLRYGPGSLSADRLLGLEPPAR